MSLKIVIPSHKRADRVISKKLVCDPIICVAESQAEEYRLHNPDCEIVTHPDDVIGLIPKRNWMAKHFGDLFMIDDDVHNFVRLYVEHGERAAIRDKVKVTRLINELYEMACLLDVHLFGFTNSCAPEQFIHFSCNPMWPWLFTNALIERKNDLRRLTKGKPQDKIDVIHGLLDCMYCFDFANGNIQQ